MNYKDFKKVNLGISDIASLVLRDSAGVCELNFGEDGNYSAYECFGDVEIGSHYTEIHTSKAWIKIYDDTGLVYDKAPLDYSLCTIYRAGEFGCILHWHN